MQQARLLAPARTEACAHCAALIRPGAQAWWDDDERLWTCTACVPPDEATRHSVGYTFAPTDHRGYSGLF